MAETAANLPALPNETQVAEYVGNSPADMYRRDGLADLLFKVIEKQVDEFKPDLSTATGRQEVAAFAFKIARTKTAIDKAGKDLGEDHRKAIATLNGLRGTFVDRLQALQTRARKALDDWEAAEADRKTKADAIMADLRNSAVVDINETAAAVRQRIERIAAIQLDFAVLGPELAITAPHVKETTIKALKGAYARLVQAEADAAELKRLQDAETARQVEASNAAAAAETKRREEAAEADAAAAEELRLQAIRDAEEKGRQEAAAEAERREAERVAEEARQEEVRKAEELRRQQDADHRETIISEAAADIAKLTGLSGKKARELALSIASNGVRHVKVEF